MRSDEFISEIAFAYYLNKSKISDEEFINDSEPIGLIDNHTVRYWQGKNKYIGNHAYFFVDDDVTPSKILARIGFANNELTSIRNVTKVKGAITALCVFVVNKMNKPFVIPETEPFTLDGINWLCNLIKNGGRGIKITDNNGKYPDEKLLRTEWINAKYSGKYGPTILFFEGTGINVNLTEHVARLEIPYVWMEGEFKS
jgi:hypothetical protein